MLTASSAGAAGDSQNGETLARIWCSACHVVATDQTAASADVPTFQAIARNPLNTPERLAQFLADPHPVMPDMDLSRIEVADIIAYIETLK
ncbi:cytochrome c [Breoghania sp. L-A4]|nr:cytochrome c [Breoghania sp. L-A4]